MKGRDGMRWDIVLYDIALLTPGYQHTAHTTILIQIILPHFKGRTGVNLTHTLLLLAIRCTSTFQ
jgi:hypothetical protein